MRWVQRSILVQLRTLMMSLVIAVVASAAANAGLILNLVDQLNGTVKLSYSGFLTTSDLTLDSTGNNVADLISPNQGRIRKSGAIDLYDTNSSTSGQTFGTLGQVTATAGTGSAVRISFAAPNALGVPSGYVSNAAISGSMDFTGSIASLGLNTGTYSFVWGIGGAGRTVTLNVSSGSAAVPEPASMAIFGLGALGMAYRARRKAKA